MAVKKREGTVGTKTLYTGFFQGRILAINPSKSDLEELLGTQLNDEPVYTGEDEEKNDFVTIAVWMKADHPDNPIFSKRFRIVNKVQVNKNRDKTQFVNQSGMSSWAASEETLQSWFLTFTDKNKNVIGEKVIREALKGEAGFYEFLTAFYGGVDFRDPENNCLLDIKKLFQDPDSYIEKEYRGQLKLRDKMLATPDLDTRKDMMRDIYIDDVVGMATVSIYEKDGEQKTAQNVYGKFLKPYLMKKVRLAVGNHTLFSEKVGDKSIVKFYNDLTGQYGTKDAFTISMLEEYDESKHQQAGDSPWEDGTKSDDGIEF